MALRLSSSATRSVLVFVALMLGFSLYCYSNRNARAEFQASLETPAEKDAQGVHICVVRSASENVDNEIQGAAWVDDIALILDTAGYTKP